MYLTRLYLTQIRFNCWVFLSFRLRIKSGDAPSKQLVGAFHIYYCSKLGCNNEDKHSAVSFSFPSFGKMLALVAVFPPVKKAIVWSPLQATLEDENVLHFWVPGAEGTGAGTMLGL